MTESTAFDRIGGDKLRLVLEDFVEKMFNDSMIGFFFVGKNKQRIIQKEWEFAASFLGGPVKYTGKPIRAVHGAHPIMGGHFERRAQILRETLRDHEVDPTVVSIWMSHTEALRAQVTTDPGTECRHSDTPSD